MKLPRFYHHSLQVSSVDQDIVYAFLIVEEMAIPSMESSCEQVRSNQGCITFKCVAGHQALVRNKFTLGMAILTYYKWLFFNY